MTATKPAHTYAATVLRIIDADTVEVVVDLGFRTNTRLPLRIAHIDSPERNTIEGKAATASLTALLGTLPAAVTVRTFKPFDKYGRYLADIFIGDGVDVGKVLIETGHAVPYEGQGA